MKTARKVASAVAGVAVAGFVASQALRTHRRWDFRRRVAVITGGSRGLGLVIARELAKEGARVVILARDAAEIERACCDVARFGSDVLGIACDVRDEAQVNSATQKVLEEFGRIDVLINNAGVIQVGPIENMTKADFEDAMAVHLWGPVHTMLATIPIMRRQGQGRIVNISSIGGRVAIPHLVPYTASKFALVGLSDAMHTELAKDNILVTTVCPGLMRTGSPMNATMKGRHEQEYAWFAISDSLPLLTMSAERAAKQILRACRYGDAHVVLSLPARLIALCSAVFPKLTLEALSVIDRLLPAAAGATGFEPKTGRESPSRWAPSVLTRLSDSAARRNNETQYNGRH